jgi:hypothetical protein
MVERYSGDHPSLVRARDRRRRRATVWRNDLVCRDRLARDLVEQSHAVEHAQCARGEAVAAGLVTRELRAVQQQDVQSLRAQEVCGRRAAWSGAYDDGVMHVHHAID